MSQQTQFYKLIGTFRQKFTLKNDKIQTWFPGHMRKGMKEMNKKLHRIDCIIEVHDARVPFTGRNTNFQKQLTELRPHILLLNKFDLCDQTLKDGIIHKIDQEEQIERVLFTDLRTSDQLRHFMPEVLKIVRKSERYQRANKSEINLMVTGIPNVGKSTFINQITNFYRKGKGSICKKGALPGVTKSVQEQIRISSNPLIYIFDTPGILEPKFVNKIEDPLKLAACDLLPSRIIGNQIVADYLLFWLNKNAQFSYVELLKLDEPIDDIDEFLVKICIKNNYFIKRKDLATKQYVPKPDLELATVTFLKLFQTGKLGKFTLDVDLIM